VKVTAAGGLQHFPSKGLGSFPIWVMTFHPLSSPAASPPSALFYVGGTTDLGRESDTSQPALSCSVMCTSHGNPVHCRFQFCAEMPFFMTGAGCGREAGLACH
jgi:hypothetical protein